MNRRDPIASFWIDSRFPSTNEYVNACRRSAYQGNSMKRQYDSITAWACKTSTHGVKKPITEPVVVCLDFYEPNMKRDIDNIHFGSKFILDGMVKAGLLKDDSQRYVRRVKPRVFIRRGETASVHVSVYPCN